MDGKNKTWTLRFPAKETLIWRRHCSIDQSCCSMTSKQFLESSSGMKFVYPRVRLANQNPGAFVSVRYTNHQSIHQSISVRLLFLFCSRVFISMSDENRSNGCKNFKTKAEIREGLSSSLIKKHLIILNCRVWRRPALSTDACFAKLLLSHSLLLHKT